MWISIFLWSYSPQSLFLLNSHSLSISRSLEFQKEENLGGSTQVQLKSWVENKGEILTRHLFTQKYLFTFF